MIIAVDGPAGSGKSTVSKLLAARLDFLYLDTGAMYRALTLKVIDTNTDVKDEAAVVALADDLDISFKQGKVFLDRRDVSADIRTPEIEKIISCVCGIAGVRENLVRLQRAVAQSQSCVCEGRDITTVVFPGAQVKVFLDASVSERARRRLKDFKDKDIDTDLKCVEEDIKRRDNADYSRKNSPLKKAADACVIDTTGLSIEETVDKIYDLVKNTQ